MTNVLTIRLTNVKKSRTLEGCSQNLIIKYLQVSQIPKNIGYSVAQQQTRRQKVLEQFFPDAIEFNPKIPAGKWGLQANYLWVRRRVAIVLESTGVARSLLKYQFQQLFLMLIPKTSSGNPEDLLFGYGRDGPNIACVFIRLCNFWSFEPDMNSCHLGHTMQNDRKLQSYVCICNNN